SPSGTLDIVDLLDRGELDLAIGSHAPPGERFSRAPLLEDEFVVVLRRNHPAAADEVLSIETFAAMPQLEVWSTPHPTDFTDAALTGGRLARRFVLRAPFLSAVPILAGSDLAALLPRRIASELVRSRPLTIRTLAQVSPVIETAMLWARRLD